MIRKSVMFHLWEMWNQTDFLKDHRCKRNILKRRVVWHSNYLSFLCTHTAWAPLHHFNFCSSLISYKPPMTSSSTKALPSLLLHMLYFLTRIFYFYGMLISFLLPLACKRRVGKTCFVHCSFPSTQLNGIYILIIH